MKVFDRLFLFIESLAIMLVSLFVLLAGVGLLDSLWIEQLLNQFYNDTDILTTTIIISVSLLLISIYLISRSVQRKEITPISKQSEIGEIKISMETLENLVVKMASKVKGVRDLKAKVRPTENELIAVLIKITFDGETPIPQITSEIQDTVKEKIEQVTGLTVGQVHVVVSNVSQGVGKKVHVE